MTPRTAEILFALPIGLVLAAAAARWINFRLFIVLTDEDSVLEWIQVVGYLVATVFGLLIARQLLRGRQNLFGLAYVLFSLGCLFVAGEEISWGQRILGLETPEMLRAVNVQEEITLHNIAPLRAAFRLLLLLMGFYGSAVAWFIHSRHREGKGEGVRLLFPPLFLTSPFFILFVYNLARFLGGALDVDRSFTLLKLQEAVEVCLPYGLGTFAFLTWRRLHSKPPVHRSHEGILRTGT